MIRDFYQAHRTAITTSVCGFAILITVAFLVAPAAAGLVALVGTWAAPVGLGILNNWERVESGAGRFIAIFGRISSRAERVGISADMQGQINGARRSLEAELEGVLPHPVRIKFVRTVEDVANLAEGEVVVALTNHRKRAENTARATLAYVKSDLIRTARPYVDARVMESADLAVAKRFLWASDKDALDFFLNSIWREALQEDPDLQQMCHEIEFIERHGLLSRVLLAEFLDLGRRLYPELPGPEVYRATVGFVHHLFRLTSKRPDEELGEALVFQQGFIRVGVVLVADRGLAERAGARPYVWRCIQDIKSGCVSVYLLARGGNCRLIPDVITGLDGNGRILDIEDPHEYTVQSESGPVQVVCVRVVADQRGYGTPVKVRQEAKAS